MRENEQPTVFPLRIMRFGLPPADTVGRVLVRHRAHGFMVGELLRANGPLKPPVLCAVGIETSPARNPTCILFQGSEAQNCVEWMPLLETTKVSDRVRAKA